MKRWGGFSGISSCLDSDHLYFSLKIIFSCDKLNKCTYEVPEYYGFSVNISVKMKMNIPYCECFNIKWLTGALIRNILGNVMSKRRGHCTGKTCHFDWWNRWLKIYLTLEKRFTFKLINYSVTFNDISGTYSSLIYGMFTSVLYSNLPYI